MFPCARNIHIQCVCVCVLVGQGKHHKGSFHDHDRQSVGKQSEGHAPSVVEYENTYKLAPDSRFQENQVYSFYNVEEIPGKLCVPAGRGEGIGFYAQSAMTVISG